jgi:DNA-binding transcriptional MerR regulator
MRTYSIKDLENFSGTKAHTIRIWEQRYNLFTPQRTETGIRYYDDTDLKKILATTVLLKSGMKISKISYLSKDDFFDELNKIDSDNVSSDSKIELSITRLILAGLNFNEQEIHNEFKKLKKDYDTYNIQIKVVYPLLTRIGIMWGKDEMTPLQEHFISNIIRQKLLIDTDILPISNDKKNEIVLFLPENETHEIGLLFANYILKKEGFKTIYLGQQVPISNLISFINEEKIKKALGFVFLMPGSVKLKKMITQLSSKCENTQFYWGGSTNSFNSFELPKNQILINSIEDFKNTLINSKNV